MEIKKYDKFFESNKLDYILDKINKFGEESLTDNERKFLSGGSSDDMLNPYLLKILSDYNDGKVNENIMNNFIDKYIEKKDLLMLLMEVYKDGNLKKYLK